MKNVTLNQLKKSSGSGFLINHFTPHQPPPDDSDKLGAHRDDFYMFFLLESGRASMMIDFNEVLLPECSIFYVLPGQVHQRFSTAESATGWFLAIESSLIPEDYREIFESPLLLQQPIKLFEQQVRQGVTLLGLADERNRQDHESPFHLPVLLSLLQSFAGIVAGSFKGANGPIQQLSRPAQLSGDFKRLLLKQLVTVKKPSLYAQMLNVSETYLNEVIKKTTGFTVSYWINHQMVLEAKRLLYYSQFNVKEIAHQLGYEDATYFMRTFKKFTGMTPLGFRSEYRK
jgi:AraC family transcriptional activator of pobA